MAIQITLSANEFNHEGTYNDHQYTSIRVNYTSNGRIYFHTIRNGMRLSTMAKQMKLVDGNVIISFGKNDKLIIGTYTDDSIQEETKEESEKEMTTNTIEKKLSKIKTNEGLAKIVIDLIIKDNANKEDSAEYIQNKKEITRECEMVKEWIDDKLNSGNYGELTLEGLKNSRWNINTIDTVIPTNDYQCSNVEHLFTNVIRSKQTPNVIDYIVKDNYAYEISEGKDIYNINPNGRTYTVICINLITGNIDNSKFTCYDEGICQVIYLSKEEVLKDINSYHTKQTESDKQTKSTKPTNKPAQINESFPKINMVADYATIQYEGNAAHIIFTNGNESNTITFKYRKSWSARKYIDTAFNKTGIKPSWEFRYGWEYIS